MNDVEKAKLRDLIIAWRDEAEYLRSAYAYGPDDIFEQEAPLRKFEALKNCADQLEAVIGTSPELELDTTPPDAVESNNPIVCDCCGLGNRTLHWCNRGCGAMICQDCDDLHFC